MLKKYEETGDSFCRNFIIAFLYSRIANIIYTIGHTDYNFRIDNINYNPQDALQDITVTMIKRIDNQKTKFSSWIQPKHCEAAIYKLLILKFKDWIYWETKSCEKRNELFLYDSEINCENVAGKIDSELGRSLLDLYIKQRQRLTLKILRNYRQPYYLKMYAVNKSRNHSNKKRKFEDIYLDCVNIGREVVSELCKSPDITIEKEKFLEIAKKYYVGNKISMEFLVRFYQHQIRKWIDRKMSAIIEK